MGNQTYKYKEQSLAALENSKSFKNIIEKIEKSVRSGKGECTFFINWAYEDTLKELLKQRGVVMRYQGIENNKRKYRACWVG